MAERFVKTADARQMVMGREIEILNKTGVDWRPNQKGHITCPHHGGQSDWRFEIDRKTGEGRCYCTCLDKPHSIFDHMSMMRGDDPKGPGAYERSKIEAAELLGRNDLI